mgnify:CR=1 FL=1
MNTINNLINSLNMMEPLAQFEVIMLQQDFNIIPYVFLNGFLNNVIISLNFFITENVKNNTWIDTLNLVSYYLTTTLNLEIGFRDFFDDYVLYNSGNVFYYTNNTKYSYLLLLVVILFLFLPIVNNLVLIPNNWQIFLENLYKFVINILDTQVGKEAQRFFPYVFVVFIFILTSNMLGMTLFSFTLTSHIMVTFTLGVSSFIGLTILGFFLQKLSFLNLFLPKGIPSALIPILVVVEIISYTSRALSLSIRLFANLMSGHTLLHILAFFSSKLFKVKYLVGLLSFLLILAIVVLEFCIAILQAYVFTILICIYLNDSFHAAH